MSTTIKQAIEALKTRIAGAYEAVSAKGGTLPATQDSANLPSAIASIPSGGGEFAGWIRSGGVEVQSYAEIVAYGDSIIEIDDNNIEYLGDNDFFFANVTKLRMRKLKRVLNTIAIFSRQSKIKEAIFDECTSFALATVFWNTPIKKMVIPMWNGSIIRFYGAANLIDIVIGQNINNPNNNARLDNWNPTNALNASSSSLVEQGEPFANNLEKLLYNIREHIAANLPVANFTFTFSAAVKAAILADQPTADAFTNKGWTIA